MERVKALIKKLQDQVDQKADDQSILATVQLLQAQLTSRMQSFSPHSTTGKVAIVMPNNSQGPRNAFPENLPEEPGGKAEMEVSKTREASPDSADWLQNLMQQIPTLAHQQGAREINEVINLHNGGSINDMHKKQAMELGESLTREPVRDLKKAIGINDRFVFVNELFRGDEVMYERSIKTINSFNVLQEAEFWMERELKLKLAWDDTKEAVMHFCQLVRRRFA